MCSKYVVGRDGKTPCERKRGKKCNLVVVPFEERVLYKQIREGKDRRTLVVSFLLIVLKSVSVQFERNPIHTSFSTKEMSRIKCGHPGNFLNVSYRVKVNEFASLTISDETESMSRWKER